MKRHFVRIMAVLCLLSFFGEAQNSSNSSASVSVPPVIQFTNVASDEGGTPLTGTVSITFSLYNTAVGGQALWNETQSVQLGNAGQYSVYLGLTQANGLPTNLFISGQAQWLGVKIESQPEQARVFLVSVPYAMKAGDAATVGGLPPSAFVMAATGSVGGSSSVSSSAGSNSSSDSSLPPNGAITGAGTVDFIPMWDTTSDIVDSVLFQSGTKIGINTTTPASTLDIKGSSTVRGTLNLPATGTATSSGGFNSQPITQVASAFNSRTAVNQTFEWQAEPVNNNTSGARGTLNLLFGQGVSKPSETGLSIASNGQITFAPGQAFLGAGTVTSVASGTGLTGGPITSSGTLQIDPTVVPELNAGSNNFAGSITASSFTGNGAGLTNVDAATLNGLTSSAFAPAGTYATLGANTFNGTQTVTGAVSTTTGFQIGGVPFDYGTVADLNAFLGFAGTSTAAQNLTGVGVGALASDVGDVTGNGWWNTAVGARALKSNNFSGTPYGPSAALNSALGYEALYKNITGSYNTAAGTEALYYNITGGYNTSLGFLAGTDSSTTNLNNATAIGAFADVSQSNSLVLGAISNKNGCTSSNNCTSANVGIGTTAPAYALDVYGTGHFTQAVTFGSPVNFASGQTFPGAAELTGTNTFTGNQTVDGAETVNGNEAVNGNLTVTSGANPTVSIGTLTTAGTFDLYGTETVTGSETLNGSVIVNGSEILNGTESLTGNLDLTGQFPIVSIGESSFPGILAIGGTAFDYGSTGTENAYLGFAGSGSLLSSGQQNTGVGFQALLSNTAAGSSGGFNTAIGSEALYANTSGGHNTASGANALLENNTGSYNTATGVSALYSNTSGGVNTAVGNQALFSNTTGSSNTATGDYALDANTTGSYNTANGYAAFNYNTAGSGNTGLGYLAGPDSTVGTINNATAVGAYADVTQSNSLVLGAITGQNQCTSSSTPPCQGVNVGIGTTAPKYTLHVVDNGSGGAGIGVVSSIVGDSAVYGRNTATSGTGTNGGSFYTSSPQGAAVVGVNQASDSVAAYFGGNVTITGNLSKGSGSFKIDDPLDPANKYLYHSFVESPDMMNIYNGNVTTDDQGLAVVLLPKYFEALNRDFRYQLTVMGQFAQAIIEQEVADNRFVIRTDKPNVKVSWQVTGIRQDAYAKAHPVPVEVEKPEDERGHYLHPELFGASEQDRIGPPR